MTESKIDFDNRVSPKTPSVLILTNPNIDVRGRFGRGELGWLEKRSQISDQKSMEKAKMEAGKGKVKMKSEASLTDDVNDRVVMSIPVSSDVTLSQLREQGVTPVTQLQEIRGIASAFSNRYGIPITVSSDMGNNRYNDISVVKEAGVTKINLHPILQYRDKQYIESKIMEAIGECRELQRQKAFGWQRG